MSGWTGGDEIVGGVLDICSTERITSAVFSGIGGCNEALNSKLALSAKRRYYNEEDHASPLRVQSGIR